MSIEDNNVYYFHSNFNFILGVFNMNKNPREIDRVIEFCRSLDELITDNPGSSTLEVLEPLRLKMCDKLKVFDYAKAETIAYCILLHWQGQHKEAEGCDK